MDRLEAHLDLAWELLDQGDVTGATAAADEAAALAPDGGELLTLRGAIAATTGRLDEALALYRAAMDKDPKLAAPLIQTAEVHLYSLEEPERALEMADRACDLAELPAERADALLLAAEAQLALDERDAARESLAAIGDDDLDEAPLCCRAGQLLFDLEQLDDAERQFRAAIELDPTIPDAYHGLGMVLELQGDTAGMRDAWLRARKYDLQSPRAPWHITQAEFETVAEAAFDSLPDAVKHHLENVPILICDYPSIEVIAEGNDPRMLGLFVGVPMGHKSSVGGGQTRPDCVFLYQRNIENACRDGEELEREIHITLWHETAHYFGLDDHELGDIGLG